MGALLCQLIAITFACLFSVGISGLLGEPWTQIPFTFRLRRVWCGCAGLRVVVEAHGGHFWSTQGSVQRPLDITSLRIDQAERMSLQLADALISPTAYMTAFLKQRAWRLPKTSLVIPNVMPSADSDAAAQARMLSETFN